MKFLKLSNAKFSTYISAYMRVVYIFLIFHDFYITGNMQHLCGSVPAPESSR